MRIMVMDGQGGGIGKNLVEELTRRFPKCEILAVGTNATATANMMKGGTGNGATGENAVIFNSKRADVIVGPMGIVLANAMLGEVTPAMAMAVSGSEAEVFLIPMMKCGVSVVGVSSKKPGEYIKEAADRIEEWQMQYEK